VELFLFFEWKSFGKNKKAGTEGGKAAQKLSFIFKEIFHDF